MTATLADLSCNLWPPAPYSLVSSTAMPIPLRHRPLSFAMFQPPKRLCSTKYMPESQPLLPTWSIRLDPSLITTSLRRSTRYGVHFWLFILSVIYWWKVSALSAMCISLGRHQLAMHKYPLLSPPAPRGSSPGLTTGDESGALSWEAHKFVESS
jgi:hypothetical protein